jgi:hypothetical protein
MRFSLGFFFLLLGSIALLCIALLRLSPVQLFFLENGREVCWFRLLRHRKQQSIDLLVIIDYYSVYLIAFFFVNNVYMHAHSLFYKRVHTCTNEANNNKKKKEEKCSTYTCHRGVDDNFV